MHVKSDCLVEWRLKYYHVIGHIHQLRKMHITLAFVIWAIVLFLFRREYMHEILLLLLHEAFVISGSFL